MSSDWRFASLISRFGCYLVRRFSCHPHFLSPLFSLSCLFCLVSLLVLVLVCVRTRACRGRESPPQSSTSSSSSDFLPFPPLPPLPFSISCSVYSTFHDRCLPSLCSHRPINLICLVQLYLQFLHTSGFRI